jgi:CBS domain-containing protein
MSIESVTVESIMTKDVKTVDADQGVNVVASIMSENNIGSVVITGGENKITVGIITERDIVRISGTTKKSMLQLHADDIMSKPVITINAKSSIKDAIQTMRLNNIRRLPVINSEKGIMVGIVTESDIFRAIMESQSLLTTIGESIVMEQYKPVYERFSEFMLGEMLLPTTTENNQLVG